jgi:hypothetical protein
MQTELRGYVVEELARTQLTSKPATFVEISNAIEGIGKMQSDRRAKNLKLDPQWETVRQWLVAQRRARASSRTETETPSEAILPVEQSA